MPQSQSVPSPKESQPKDLLGHTVIKAHDPATGRIDSKRFADVLAISTQEMAKILHRTPRGITKNPASPKIQDDMVRIMKMYQSLLDIFDGSNHYVRIWLKAPHPDLGGQTPLSFLEDGKPEVVESLLRAIETGQPG
jgi:hypothetical protein